MVAPLAELIATRTGLDPLELDPAQEITLRTGLRGRRPGKRTRLQEIQKQNSRQKIRDAAVRVFQEKSYIAATIDDIVAEAGVSRVTFYKHFDNKFDVAESINEHYLQSFSEDYALLARSSDPDEDDILEWMHHILRRFPSARETIAMIAAMSWQDPALIRSRTKSYASIVASLGEHIPAFQWAASGHDEEARIRAHLLIVQLNELCYELAVCEWPVNHEVALRIAARQFREFIMAGGRSPPALAQP